MECIAERTLREDELLQSVGSFPFSFSPQIYVQKMPSYTADVHVNARCRLSALYAEYFKLLCCTPPQNIILGANKLAVKVIFLNSHSYLNVNEGLLKLTDVGSGKVEIETHET